MTNISKELEKKRNDSIIQSSCDRRTLATVALHLHKNGISIISQSQLTRTALEMLEQILVNNGAEQVRSTEDAANLLEQLGAGNLNPSGRRLHTLSKSLVIEDAYLEGTGSYVLSPLKTKDIEQKKIDEINAAIPEAEKIYAAKMKKQKEKDEPYKSRMPDNVVLDDSEPETLEKAQSRRESELKDMKAALAAKPKVFEDRTTENKEEED